MKKIVKFRKNLILTTLLLTIAIINFGSCSQKQGESCFVNNDCEGEDYVCCMSSPDSTKGICKLKSECIKDFDDTSDTSDSSDFTDTQN